MEKATAFTDLFPLPLPIRPGPRYIILNTKLRTGAGSAAGRAGRLSGDAVTGVRQSRNAASEGKGSGNQSWASISTRCSKPEVARKPKTNVVPPHCALAWVSSPKGRDRVLFDAVPRPGLRGSTSR